MRRLPVVLSLEEFNSILKIVKNPEYKIAFKLGFLCGLRVSEIVNLQKEHIDLDRGLIYIKEGKGEKDRYVPIPEPLRKDLKIIPLTIGIRALQIAFKKAAKKAGITKDIHFHSLRHSAGTYYLNQGMSLRQVQTLLGHSRVTTTEIYTHVTPDDLKNKMGEIWK